MISTKKIQPVKWSWDDLGFPTSILPNCRKSTAIANLELMEDADAITDLLAFPESCSFGVRFYRTIGVALVVTIGSEVRLTDEQLDRVLHLTQWSVKVLTATEFKRMCETAYRQFERIENLPDALPNVLIENGIFDYFTLSFVDPIWLAAQRGMTKELAEKLIKYVEFRIRI